MDYTYTVKQKTIKCSISDTHILIPFGDIHRDTKSCDVERWLWFLQCAEKTMKENRSTHFVCMGDVHDFASISEVKKIKSANLHDDTYDNFDLGAQEKNRKICEEMKFMRGRMLGFVEGNHNWMMQDGKSANEDLAERMGTESLGWLCHYSVRFDFNDESKKSQTIHMVLCHGKAGGTTEGASLNQLDQLRRIFPAADIYIMGHDHQRLAKPASVIIPVQDRRGGFMMKQKRQFLIRSGSFKKGYGEGTHSYEISRLLRPSDLGAVMISLQFHRSQKDDEDRIITDLKVTI
jgi:predicted phosphodiesterase